MRREILSSKNFLDKARCDEYGGISNREGIADLAELAAIGRLTLQVDILLTRTPSAKENKNLRSAIW